MLGSLQRRPLRVFPSSTLKIGPVNVDLRQGHQEAA
jgi:hypothetical protein